MRRSPPIIHAFHYPITTGTALTAIVVSLTWWSGQDISFLMSNLSIERGQLWRLITDVLPHINILHLAFNLIWLWLLGSLIESHLGSAKTLLLFLYLAVGSSAAEFAFLQGGVGLSGVVYGLAGFVWLLQRHDQRFANAIDNRNATLLVVWFIFCIYTTATGIFPIGNIAHGFGTVLGFLLAWSIERRSVLNRIGIPTAVLLIALLSATIVRPYINHSPYRAYEEGLRGYQALLDHRYAKAFYWLRLSTARDPSVAEVWFNLGIASQHQEDWPAATAAYHKALELKPQDVEYQDTCRQMDAYLSHSPSTQPAS